MHRSNYLVLTRVIIVAFVCLSVVFPAAAEDYDIGPSIGLRALIGFQEMARGETVEGSNPIITESIMEMSIPAMTLSWGLGTERIHFEPAIHIGRLASAEFSGGSLCYRAAGVPGKNR